MKLFRKVKWILGILFVFGLILATNLIDRRHFTQIRDTAITIYEDRLLAKNIIFDINQEIHEKELATVVFDSSFFKERNVPTNEAIQQHLTKFRETKFLQDEKKALAALKEDLKKLTSAENAFAAANFQNNAAVLKAIDDVKKDLYVLSDIQLQEGKKQMFLSKKSIDAIELFTEMEIYILVFLAIIIQFIIFSQPKVTN